MTKAPLKQPWLKVLLLSIFGIFVVAQGAYLHRVPGLLGDEASEGENVFEKLDVFTNDESEVHPNVLITGERSYIGPLIDYVRVPFVWMFGYTALALRLPIFLVSIVVFWVAWDALSRQFGTWPAIFGVVMLVFSPAYILYQRLGWAITLFVPAALLMVWLMQREWKHKWVLVGFVGGLSLANHVIFLPTLAGVAAGLAVYAVWGWIADRQLAWREVLDVWPGIIGFIAGFGMQYIVLALDLQGDQGDPNATTQLFGERVSGWLDAFPLYVSGSSYVARYVGEEFSRGAMLGISYVLLGLALLGVALLWKKRALWAWAVGLAVHMLVLLYVIDRFTLRYFVVISLGVWLLAGLGIGAGLGKLLRKKEKLLGATAAVLAVALTGWMAVQVWVPFLQTGGSVQDFSLGDRENSAAAFVDERSLIECLRGAGPVHTENIHIWNRLQYVSHEFSDLEVLADDEADNAQWLVHYREPDAPGGLAPGDRCPELAHFRVVRR